MKTLKYNVLIGLLIGFSHLGFTQIVIEDQNLEMCIKDILEIGIYEDITQEMADSLVSIDASYLDIINLDGVEKFRNLKFLFLSGNKIVDLTPVTFLSQLSVLDVSYNNITDITPLLLCASDKISINLNHNCISDFSDIQNNWLTDIELIDIEDQCDNSIYIIHNFSAELLDENNSEVRFIYRAIGIPNTNGWLNFGNGDSTQIIANGVIDTLVYIYQDIVNIEATLNVGDVSKKIPLDLLKSNIELISPENLEITPSVNTWFKWHSNSFVENYHFVLFDSDTTIIYEVTNMSDTIFQFLYDTLANNSSYFWKVRGSDEYSTSLWSERWNFSIVNDTPVIIQPLPNFAFIEDHYNDTVLVNFNEYFSDTIPDSTLIYSVIFDSIMPDYSIVDSLFVLHLTPNFVGNCNFKINAKDQGNLSLSVDMSIDILPKPTVDAGQDSSVCAGSIYTLLSSAENYGSIFWSTNGDGNFDDSLLINPIYTPGENDIDNGSVILILTADAIIQDVLSVNDSVVITIHPIYIDSLNINICQGDSVILGTSILYQTGIYIEVFNTVNGCDSTVVLDLVVNPLPAASITANGSTTICEGNYVELNANINTGLTYKWLKDGSYITGATSDTYFAYTNGDYQAEVSNQGNCSDLSNAIALLSEPIYAYISITATETNITAGTEVTFTVATTNEGNSPQYQWKLNGSSVGTNSETFTSSTLSNGDEITCMLFASGSCITNNPALSNTIIMIVDQLQQTFELQNVTIANGQSECYNATSTITVAGSETTVDIQSGGEATFIAGETIYFMPGFHSYSGSTTNAYITTTGDYCSSQQSMISSPDIVNDLPELIADEESRVNIYPNPTTGNFTIDFLGEATTADILLLNFQGATLLEQKCKDQKKIDLDISYLSEGMYIIVIKTKTELITKKIIKNY